LRRLINFRHSGKGFALVLQLHFFGWECAVLDSFAGLPTT
jgi:hypothetical protein